MAISLFDLSPKAQEQVIAKLAIEEARRRKREKSKTEQKKNKFKAEKVSVELSDGAIHTFDSKREYARYQELAIMERAEEISDLRMQVEYELVPKQKKKDGTTERGVIYRADFVYQKGGETVVEDTKGYRTKDYIIKRKLMLWRYGIEIKEV